jgi:hypothetical protein
LLRHAVQDRVDAVGRHPADVRRDVALAIDNVRDTEIA